MPSGMNYTNTVSEHRTKHFKDKRKYRQYRGSRPYHWQLHGEIIYYVAGIIFGKDRLNTMKRTNIVIKGIAVALVFAASTAMFSSCSRSRDSRDRTDLGSLDPASQREAKIVVKPVESDSIIERYFPELKEYDDFDIEEVYADWGGFSIGPTEYEYRGIIYLTEDEAERLMAAYEWEETEAPEFEFGEVDTSSIGEGPWYSCKQFEKDNIKMVNVTYAVFDGEKLVFDIHQT